LLKASKLASMRFAYSLTADESQSAGRGNVT
jgi:hypothetical protein